MDITQLLCFGVEMGASDCHLSAGESPLLRVDGDLKRLDRPALTKEEVHTLIYDMLSDHHRRTLEEHLECDLSFEVGELARFRVNVFIQRRGLAAVFRMIPSKVPSMAALGFPGVLKQLCTREKGLILVTGPTGCGKTTTLAAMLDHLNSTFEGHVLTIEDPIEFVHHSRTCLINQREVGTHTRSFAAALRSALREDPDVILVGEMRDLETIQLALTAAETGHLVFATLHTPGAPQTVDRIIDVFPPSQQSQVRAQFAESIEAIISQALLKKKGGGRVPALEIMTGTIAVRNLIREAKIHQLAGVMQASQAEGMQTMDMALQHLVSQGAVTQREAQSRSMTPELFPSHS